jgi:hypothetical protein
MDEKLRLDEPRLAPLACKVAISSGGLGAVQAIADHVLAHRNSDPA